MADTTPTHRTPTYLTPPHLHILHQHIWHQHMAHSESHVYICIYTYIYIFAILHGHIGRHLMAHSELYLYLNICMSHSTTTHRTPTYGTQWIACVYIYIYVCAILHRHIWHQLMAHSELYVCLYICMCHSTTTHLTPTHRTPMCWCQMADSESHEYIYICICVPFYATHLTPSYGTQWIICIYIYVYVFFSNDTSDTNMWHTSPTRGAHHILHQHFWYQLMADISWCHMCWCLTRILHHHTQHGTHLAIYNIFGVECRDVYGEGFCLRV